MNMGYAGGYPMIPYDPNFTPSFNPFPFPKGWFQFLFSGLWPVLLLCTVQELYSKVKQELDDWLLCLMNLSWFTNNSKNPLHTSNHVLIEFTILRVILCKENMSTVSNGCPKSPALPNHFPGQLCGIHSVEKLIRKLVFDLKNSSAQLWFMRLQLCSGLVQMIFIQLEYVFMNTDSELCSFM